MLVGVVTDPSQLSNKIDALELRLDYFPDINIEQLIHNINLPIILTLRSKDQGGHYHGDEASRLQTLEKLLSLKPDYVDIEYNVPLQWVRKCKKKYPDTKIICSYHNF